MINVFCVGGPLDDKVIDIDESHYEVGFRFHVMDYQPVKLEPNYGNVPRNLECVTHTYLLTEYVTPGGLSTLRALHASS